MPKKSNKTAHVLNLLTNGSDEPQEEKFSISKSDNESKPSSILEFQEPSESKNPEIIVELQGSTQSDSLSNLVKSDLEKEFNKQISKTPKKNYISEEYTDTNQRPPYSATFMSKFGVDIPEKDITNQELSNQETIKEETIKEEAIPPSSGQIKSQLYVLENFNDEDEESEPMESKNISTSTNDVSSSISMHTESTKILHNLAEDFIKVKAPEIMKSLNMCTCQDCVYDVMTLALNHTQPLYTVTEKGALFQKLNAYELQYGTDLASEIAKACIKVKLNPRHPNINKK